MTLWDKDEGYRRLLLRKEDREPRGRLPEVWTQRPGSSPTKEKERGSLKTGQENSLVETQWLEDIPVLWCFLANQERKQMQFPPQPIALLDRLQGKAVQTHMPSMILMKTSQSWSCSTASTGSPRRRLFTCEAKGSTRWNRRWCKKPWGLLLSPGGNSTYSECLCAS